MFATFFLVKCHNKDDRATYTYLSALLNRSLSTLGVARHHLDLEDSHQNQQRHKQRHNERQFPAEIEADEEGENQCRRRVDDG